MDVNVFAPRKLMVLERLVPPSCEPGRDGPMESTRPRPPVNHESNQHLVLWFFILARYL